MNKLETIMRPAPCEYFDNHPEYGKHVYVAKRNGKLWPGVSSMTDNLNKPFLVFWAAKEVAKAFGYFDKETYKDGKKTALSAGEIKAAVTAMKKTLLSLRKMTPKQYYEFVCEAKAMHRRKKEEAAESGTLAHDYIQAHISGDKKKLLELRPKLAKDLKAKSAVNAFAKWEKENKVEWLASELIVGSDEHEFGGRLDAIANVNGILTLIDFKTSNQISQEYFWQVAGYAIALEEMGVIPMQRMILRIPKDGKEFETATIVPKLDENRQEVDKMIFLALRNLTKGLSFYNNAERGIKENGRIKVDKKNGESKNN